MKRRHIPGRCFQVAVRGTEFTRVLALVVDGRKMIAPAIVSCPPSADSALPSRMHDFRRLKVWQLSRELAVAADDLTRRFPRADRGIVGGQLRRAALSIPANIAEGCGKSSRKDTVRFLQIALGSAKETENHLLIASDLHYLHPKAREELLSRIHSIQRMLIGLMRNLPNEAPNSWG